MQTVFWIVFLLLFYTYIGYGLLLFLFNSLFKKKVKAKKDFYPHLTFIVAAYNEEIIIEKKILNTLVLEYPADKISFLFITDGSDDNTVAIIGRYPQISLRHQALRKGKSAAINRAMQTVATPIVVFSDANTLLHPQSIKKLVGHYCDEKVGGVSGEKRIKDMEDSTIGFGERLYWQYESLLKKANSDFYTIVGAAGELFSIRTKLYYQVDEHIILDDFVISARVCGQGYRFLYESEAYGIETSSTTIAEERKRKIRISAGSFQALLHLKSLLNFARNFKVAFQYVSHRVLRWTVCPLLLPSLFVINSILFFDKIGPVYEAFFFAQCGFYCLAFLGWLFAGKRAVVKSLFVPYYFVFMILSQYEGFFRFITKKQSGVWEKAVRKKFTGSAGF
jgi:cellulose synthase/poly-beta-1,6-N-acetylglucosamine synthase-like glycosyltransferase